MLLVAVGAGHGEEPADVPATAPAVAARLEERGWWEVVTSEVPPLRHRLGDRWPMITWHNPGVEPLSQAQVQALLERGLTQHLRLDTALVASAQALQAAGSKVILMEGGAGSHPYSLAPDSSQWAHQFDEGYTYEMAGAGALGSWHGACPLQIAGWRGLARRVRETLTAFRDAGVTVDAVWMDWEGDPYPWIHLFKQRPHCARCRAQLSAEVLEDYDAWFAFSWRLYAQLYGSYFAGPAREVFPMISATNWHVVFSSVERPALYFVDDRVLPPMVPPLFTASNPVAYGNDQWWNKHWQDGFARDRRHVDQFYTHNLLRQVSADEANRRRWAPQVQCVPWVARWCPIAGGEAPGQVPDISREAWREVLRHLWLRGVDGMQVFNPWREGFEEQWVEELQDAVAAYDEALAFPELLDRGEVMNLEVPAIQDDGVLWSGLRSGDQAVVRAVSLGEADQPLMIRPWPAGPELTLTAPVEGATYLIEDTGARVAQVAGGR